MAKIVRLTERDLTRLVKRVIQERKEDTMGMEELKKLIKKYSDEVERAHSMSTTDLEIISDELVRLSKMIQKNKKLATYERFDLKKQLNYLKRDIQDEIDDKVDKDR
jgi:hypothetical protein